MPSEVAEVIDVMTRSGYLMYEIILRTGQAAVLTARCVHHLTQMFHRRYGLNGQVRLRDLARLEVQGTALVTASIPAEKLELFRQFAAGCCLPFAVTEVPGENNVLVTFSQDDIPALRPFLQEQQAGRLNAAQQWEHLKAGRDAGPGAYPPEELHLAAVRADAEGGGRITAALQRRGVHAVSTHAETPAGIASEASRPDTEYLLYPAAEESAVQGFIGEMQLEAEFLGAVARPVDRERSTFADHAQRRHAATHTENPDRELPQERQEPAPREEAPERQNAAAVFAAAEVPAGPSAEALEAALLERAVPTVRLDRGSSVTFLTEGGQAGGLLSALSAASLAAAVEPAAPDLLAEAAYAFPKKLEALRDASARAAGPPLAALRESSLRGTRLAAADGDLSIFTALAAKNPDISAKNLFAAAGQGATGRLVPPSAWLKEHGAIPPGISCIWTGEPRRDSAGNILRRKDPQTGREMVEMDCEPYVAAEQLGAVARTEPAPPDAGELAAALGCPPDGAGLSPDRLLAEHVLSEVRLRQRTKGPLAEAEAALAACIVLEHFSLPVPEDALELASRRQLTSLLAAEKPSFAPFERARQQAQSTIQALETQLAQQRAAVRSTGMER